MNSLFIQLGLQEWKPVVLALLLPPVPFLLLILIGTRLVLPRRGLGWLVVLSGLVGIWLGGCTGVGRLIDTYVLQVPHALSEARIDALRAPARPAGTKGTAAPSADSAIVVLGGGLEPYAPEYGVSNLSAVSLERLRYGVWLGRRTGLPVAFSGGAGWAGRHGEGESEADAAARTAAQDFGRPLRWIETESRDTRQNAAFTTTLLQRAGVRRIVLVTHAQHMPRALRAFREAALADKPADAPALLIEAAPMGLATRIERPLLDWLPSSFGMARVRSSLREVIGLAVGT